MPIKTRMNVSEYLKSSFEGPDCEFVDGEVIERNMGELPHSAVQMEIAYLLRQMAPQLSIQVRPEIRIQIRHDRYRVADVAVWRAGRIGDKIPEIAPFLVVEILSPEDRIVRIQPRIQEYLTAGVEWVWLVDPAERQAVCYSQRNPGGVLAETLRTENPVIEIALADVLSALPD